MTSKEAILLLCGEDAEARECLQLVFGGESDEDRVAKSCWLGPYSFSSKGCSEMEATTTQERRLSKVKTSLRRRVTLMTLPVVQTLKIDLKSKLVTTTTMMTETATPATKSKLSKRRPRRTPSFQALKMRPATVTTRTTSAQAFQRKTDYVPPGDASDVEEEDGGANSAKQAPNAS